MHLNLLSIIIPLHLFLNEILWSVATTNSPVLYHPLDNITVNCGSSGNSTAADGRQWTGDIGSNYTPLLHSNRGKLFSSKATKPPLSPDPVPYMSARLSRQPFTYTFQVSPGQKFIRLHFHPASYRGGFKRSKDFFTVKAGPYTLLSNFSASLTADALGLESLVKEYCVNVEENQPLILTLSPSLGGSSDEAYAFVNGIEIVSMPTGLYHTQEGDAGAHVVGENFRFPIGKSIALEMVQRLNIGGSSISSIEDTGMFRDWSQDSYSFMQKSNVQPVTTTLRIKYPSIPSYTAPQKVYQTSWSMVIDKQGNGTFNFTWKFPIDLGFRYLLRLHFCDFEYEIEESDRTKFSIFVNEHVVEAKADIMKWNGGNRVAVYRDYVVMMEGDRKQGKHDLLIAYFPHNHEWTEQIDTILKGLEVFKMSNPDKNLAGVNPVPLSCASTSSNAKPRKFVYASGGNAIATVLVILLTTTNISVYMLRVWGEKFNEKNTSPLLPERLCRRFSLSEVLEVTNNFNDEFVIGRGGFGNVYKALIDDGRTIVAIKRLNSKSKQGADEFWTEIEMLSNLRHTHLVSLIGYCDEQQEMILVYEYIEHGTLADHLYKHGNGTICNTSWKQRMKACIGAARGLDYLHTGTRRGIIHRDVKTTNILLDKDWVAKISDFGLCKEGTTCQLCKEGTTCHSHTYHVSTMVKGTFGYMDPEYFFTRRLTKKSDVYAFGVVLLEVLCGRPAVDLGVEEEQRSLALWAQQCIKEEKHDQLIDPILKDQISPECLKVFTEVANKCLHKHPSGRPTMTDVVASLECMLASLEQPRNACTEEEEEEEEKLDDEEDEEEDVNVHGDSDQQIYDDKNTQQNDILPQSTVASPSAPLQFNGNTQRQKRSKKNLFQRGIAFLARSIDNQISDVEIQTTASNKIIFQGMSLTTNTTPSNEGNISGTIFENSDGGGGATLSLPPIASNKPILAMLGSSIASVQMGQLRDRIDAAYNLASLARDNDRNKKMIVEEGGVVPLLKLLKEGASAEAQIAAAAALSNLGNDQERVRFIAMELAVPIIVKVLVDSPMKVQVAVANLVAKMVEMDPMVQEEFGRENVTRPLVTLLDTVLDDPTPKLQPGKPSLHSLVQINKELAGDSFNHIPHSSSLSSLHKKERGVESPELKLDLKISCAKALWKLSRGSLLHSRKITETKGLLVLAKLIEKERGELQSNCLMAVMELAAVAESNTDLRRAAFKSNSPAAKAVLEQILRVVNEESSLTLLIPAIRSLGSLARTFPAKESRIIGPLVAQLGHRNIDVASEAAIALGKFACPDNFNRLEHSKAIIDADGVSRLMNLIRISGRDQVNELTLLCFLALTVGNSKALEQARALGVIEGAARSVGSQHPDKRELFAKAIHHLTLYQAGDHTHRQAFAP